MKRIIVLTVATLMAAMIAAGTSAAFAQEPCDPFGDVGCPPPCDPTTDVCPPPEEEEPPPSGGGGGGGDTGFSLPAYYYDYANYGTRFAPVDPYIPSSLTTRFSPVDPYIPSSLTTRFSPVDPYYPTDPIYPVDPIRNFGTGYGY